MFQFNLKLNSELLKKFNQSAQKELKNKRNVKINSLQVFEEKMRLP